MSWNLWWRFSKIICNFWQDTVQHQIHNYIGRPVLASIHVKGGKYKGQKFSTGLVLIAPVVY